MGIFAKFKDRISKKVATIKPALDEDYIPNNVDQQLTERAHKVMGANAGSKTAPISPQPSKNDRSAAEPTDPARKVRFSPPDSITPQDTKPFPSRNQFLKRKRDLESRVGTSVAEPSGQKPKSSSELANSPPHREFKKSRPLRNTPKEKGTPATHTSASEATKSPAPKIQEQNVRKNGRRLKFGDTGLKTGTTAEIEYRQKYYEPEAVKQRIVARFKNRTTKSPTVGKYQRYTEPPIAEAKETKIPENTKPTPDINRSSNASSGQIAEAPPIERGSHKPNAFFGKDYDPKLNQLDERPRIREGRA